MSHAQQACGIATTDVAKHLAVNRETIARTSTLQRVLYLTWIKLTRLEPSLFKRSTRILNVHKCRMSQMPQERCTRLQKSAPHDRLRNAILSTRRRIRRNLAGAQSCTTHFANSSLAASRSGVKCPRPSASIARTKLSMEESKLDSTENASKSVSRKNTLLVERQC